MALVAVALMASAALAVLPPAGAVLTGNSAHSRYNVQITMQCYLTSCRRASTFDLSVGSLHPKAPCGPNSYQFPPPKFRKGTWSAFATFGGSHGEKLKFSVTVTFPSTKRASGKIVGPKACGGTDTFKVSVSPTG